ncbi:hypothetical protein A7U60_g4012 [Sanghuangporus baumii]|uniref:F-box domain-containing protein n=1 Tax=Sanghuangporus baumii TaxID=108892 RepID=A0A9Q5HZF3_SANBA|nr:hypothetical protein A7U60_g4012 [Sanghuangporus baumii]
MAASFTHTVRFVIPSDIWYAIIELLNKHDLERISSASRQLRVLALPKLFESISLRLGVMDDNDSDDEKERARMSVLVLRKMANPQVDGTGFDFARFIRELRIIWVNKNSGFFEERHYLLQSLQRLAKLRHFAWVGFRLPAEIANDISCAEISLSLQVDSINEVFAHDLSALNRLQSIETVYDCRTYVESSSTQRYVYAAFWDVLNRNQSYLKRLSICGDAMRNISALLTGIAANLTDLAINEVGDFPELETLLQETSALESLTLLDARSLNWLPCAEDKLPRLKYLKIWIERRGAYLLDDDDPYGVSPNMRTVAKDLLGFVRLHRNLSGFDFSCSNEFEGIDTSDDISGNFMWFPDIVEAVCTLEGVRAFGLTMPKSTEIDMREALERISEHTQLKRSCTALRLGGLSDVPMEDWTTEFRNCSFVSLASGRPEETVFKTYRTPCIEELVILHSGCRLEQFCLDGQMYDITLFGPDEEDVITPWSPTRAAWRTERDFCSFDAYWLMKYRTTKEGYEAAPGSFH